MLNRNLTAQLAVAAALSLACSAHAQDAQVDQNLEQGLEAVVEMNKYVNEDTARVMFNLDPGVLEEGATAQVVVQTGDEQLTAESPLAAEGLTVVELPLADVPLGESDVTLKVLRGEDVLWQGQDKLTRLEPPAQGTRITQIDRYRRIMVVDGEPFFPMGVFGAYGEYMDELAAADFNVTLRWKGKTTVNRWDLEQEPNSPYHQQAVREWLDAAAAAGIYAVETPTKLAPQKLYHRFRDPDWHEKHPIITNQITPHVVNLAKNHPAVIAYYSYDEPDDFYPTTPDHPKHLIMREGVEAWYDVVKELDPYHSVMTLFAVGFSKNPDWEAWDVWMRDWYIYRGKHMSEVYDRTRENYQPLWDRHTPYVFTPLFEKSSGRPVPLSAEEQRAQSYLVLAGDARGLFYWDWPAAYAPNWEMLKQIAGEVNQLKPVLVERSPEQSLNYANADTEKSVKALIKNHDGKTYIIAVNAESAPVQVSYTLPQGYEGQATVLFDGENIALQDGQFSDDFEIYGRRVYELQGTWPHGGELGLDISVGEEVTYTDPEFETTDENLIANSSFEYDYGRLPGWPANWSPGDTIMESGQVGAEDGRWTPVTDEAHHGERSLRMIRSAEGRATSEEYYNELTAPAANQGVRYDSDGSYTLSAWMKADEPSRVWVTDGWNMIDNEVDVTTEWQRYEWTFNRKAGGGGPRFIMMDQGTLWLDAVQLEKGDQASEYVAIEPTN